MTADETTWRGVILTTLRLLTFRSTREELSHLNWRHLAFGLGWAWLVGIGRYWDNPRVGVLQHLGIGSVIYVFVLALFLWLIIWPLKPQNWSYFRVCTFIALVSPPALIYAIPVERLYDLNTANSINANFLAIVAAWRVALLIWFLRRVGGLNWFSVIVATMFPLTFIVAALTIMNLEKAVFALMGGLHERTSNDASYGVLIVITVLSLYLFIPLLIGYVSLALIRFVQFRQERRAAHVHSN
jgi:hypothetical protein